MSDHHRALNSLVASVSEQVEKALSMLQISGEELKTISHLIQQENWWHEEHIKRPDMYCYGPIEGTKKDLARWIFPDLKDPRCIEKANQKPGIVWVVKLPENRPQNRFQTWFTSKSMFQDAQSRKISELKTR